MGIDHCFESGSVVLDLQSTDKESALRELIRGAPVFRGLPDVAALEDAVLRREREQSTGFGHGVAVAHGRIADLEGVLIALGLSRAGIPFGSTDGQPVHLLFVIVSPPGPCVDYLQALSCLVRAIRRGEVRQSLLDTEDRSEIERRIRAAFLRDLDRAPCPQVG